MDAGYLSPTSASAGPGVRVWMIGKTNFCCWPGFCNGCEIANFRSNLAHLTGCRLVWGRFSATMVAISESLDKSNSNGIFLWSNIQANDWSPE